MTEQEILRESGLDWEVRETGVKTDDNIIIPKTKAILRINEGEDVEDTYLGIHKWLKYW